MPGVRCGGCWLEAATTGLEGDVRRRRSGDEKISACSWGGATSGLLERVESSRGFRVDVAGVIALGSA